MSSSWIIKVINVMANRNFRMFSGLVTGPPNQLGLNGFEHGFYHGIVIAIPLAAHGREHVMSFKNALVIIAAILGAPVTVMDQPGGWLA
jgi:hypothetical protein